MVCFINAESEVNDVIARDKWLNDENSFSFIFCKFQNNSYHIKYQVVY